jgi:hypothetical protein
MIRVAHKFSVPKDANAIKMTATYKDEEGDKATAEMRAVAFYSPNEMYVHVGTSTEQGRLGENAVIHLRSNFGFQVYSYVVSLPESIVSLNFVVNFNLLHRWCRKVW